MPGRNMKAASAKIGTGATAACRRWPWVGGVKPARAGTRIALRQPAQSRPRPIQSRRARLSRRNNSKLAVTASGSETPTWRCSVASVAKPTHRAIQRRPSRQRTPPSTAAESSPTYGTSVMKVVASAVKTGKARGAMAAMADQVGSAPRWRASRCPEYIASRMNASSDSLSSL